MQRNRNPRMLVWKNEELIVIDWDPDRSFTIPPVWNQFVERAGLKDVSGQDMGPDITSLVNNAHVEVGINLLRSNGTRKPRRAGSNDDHIEVHPLSCCCECTK